MNPAQPKLIHQLKRKWPLLLFREGKVHANAGGGSEEKGGTGGGVTNNGDVYHWGTI